MKRLNLNLIKIFVFYFFLGSFCQSLGAISAPTQVAPKFSLHLVSEPSSLKPWEQRNSNGLYLLGQLFGTLLKYRNGKLIPSLAEKCESTNPLTIKCSLKKGLHFSDGTPLNAEDFQRSWLELLSPENHAFRADLLFDIKNAEDFYLGKMISTNKVGIEAKGLSLTFHLKNPNPDFLFRLTSPLLSVWKKDSFKGNFDIQKISWSGAYRVKQWLPGKKISLQHLSRPEISVDFFFVSEDSVALNLFEKGELQFLRRLPTLFINKYKDRNEYGEVEFLRFDFVGFGPDLKDLPWLRKALSQSLNFSEINKLLDIHGSYGCPTLSKKFFDTLPCVTYDPNAESKFPKDFLNKIPHPLKMIFASQGGSDYQKVMEWMQSQWKKHLHLDVQIEHQDFKIFFEAMKTTPPPIFRRGIIPEDPSCLAALDGVKQTSSIYPPETIPQFEEAYKKLKSYKLGSSGKKKACSRALQALIDSNWVIPTGPVHFSFLIKPKWKSWYLNEMNQLDLEDLSYDDPAIK